MSMGKVDKIKQVSEMMKSLGVTRMDLDTWWHVESKWDQYALDNVIPSDGDPCFKGTAEEAMGALLDESFNLYDDQRWADAAYEHESDMVYDALERLGYLPKFKYQHTHYSRLDGSPAMMVEEDPFTLMNEAGDTWPDDPADWSTEPVYTDEDGEVLR